MCTPTFSYATGIADDRTIIGTARTADFSTYAVLWTPVVPEPSATAVVALALAALRAQRRRCIR